MYKVTINTHQKSSYNLNKSHLIICKNGNLRLNCLAKCLNSESTIGLQDISNFIISQVVISFSI